jgi:hypothetical protein
MGSVGPNNNATATSLLRAFDQSRSQLFEEDCRNRKSVGEV